MELEYLGWSGLVVRHGELVIAFDPFGESATWDVLGGGRTTIICLTHGHPEHVGAIRELLAAPDAAQQVESTHLVSSAQVVRYVNRASRIPADRTHTVDRQPRVAIDGVQLAAFEWRHAALLPRGWRAKGEYFRALACHPRMALGIGIAGLRAPVRAPTLGFQLTFEDGATLLNYSEGLHTGTSPEEVAQVAESGAGGTLIFAVEPENTASLPAFVKALAPEVAVIYEAHRPWRDGFGLVHVDLPAYAQQLARWVEGTRVVVAAEPGAIER